MGLVLVSAWEIVCPSLGIIYKLRPIIAYHLFLIALRPIITRINTYSFNLSVLLLHPLIHSLLFLILPGSE